MELKFYYTLKRFSRVLTDNIKQYEIIVTNSQGEQKERAKAELEMIRWAKMWVDNIRKYEKLNKKESERVRQLIANMNCPEFPDS